MKSHLKIYFFYFVLILTIIIYSYSQIDLNLTIWSNPIYQSLQDKLIYLGYYARPQSTLIFLGFIGLLFAGLLWVLKKIRHKELTGRQVWIMIAITALLLFAYPAFSHDFFNYMFDGRIVTQYHLSPYFFKALDFPTDPWTRFMHWTHRYYPYGPGWLYLSLIPSLMGMGKFTLTFILFKLLFLLFHLANCLLIQRIFSVLDKKRSVLALAFYALNPLVLIEGVVSPHNEAAMLTLAFLAIYFIVQRKPIWSVVLFAASVSIKYLSLVLIPLFRNQSEKTFKLVYGLWFLSLIPVIYLREPYAWYILPLVGLVVFTKSLGLEILTVGLSAGTTLRYWPFLLWGNYDSQVVLYQQVSLWLGVIIVGGVYYFLFRKTK